MIIKKMLVEKFRKMENLEINFGGKLTFIAGVMVHIKLLC